MLLAAGCGGGGSGPATNGEEKKPTRQIGNDAAAALKAARSVHIVGTSTDSGKKTSLNLKFQGADTAGTVTQDGHTVEIIKVGAMSFLKADRGYYQAQGVPPQAAVLTADRWVKVPASSGSAFGDITLASFADQLASGPGDGGAVTQSMLNGQKVVLVKASNGTAGYVANTGAPVPLRLEKAGADSGRFDFSEYGANFGIKAPAEPLELPTG
jgi:hypothetical protein